MRERHGQSGTSEYRAWFSLRKRARAGEIEVCPAWDRYTAFFDALGPRPGKEYRLARLDPGRPYEPGNVAWRLHSEVQAEINRRWPKEKPGEPVGDDVEGYFVRLLHDGRYVYEDGAIWRLWERRRGWLKERRRAEKRLPNAYLSLRVTVGGRTRMALAHRVIWRFFNGPIPEGLEINHIDFNRANNRIENLEVVTRRENMDHSRDRLMAAVPRGETHPLSSVSDADVETIRRRVAAGDLQKNVAADFGISRPQVSRIVNRKQRRTPAVIA